MELNRRDFLVGSAAAAAAVVVTGAAGCSSSGSATDGIKWDHEADMIAVGGGAAGLASAIEGLDKGMKSVIVLESTSNLGGSSAVCNGGIALPGTPLQEEQGIKDSVDLMIDDLVKNTGPGNDPELIKVHAEHAAELWDWLTAFGIEFKKESLINTMGQSVAREHHVTPSKVMAALKEQADKRGAKIMVNTPATRLIQDADTKRVIGVEATDDSGETIRLKAAKGVLLCSGDFSRNTDMLNQHIFGTGAETVFAYSGLGCLGQGILMAQSIGADTRSMSWIAMLSGQNPNGTAGQSTSVMNVGAVLVNKEGVRFTNDGKGYGNVWADINAQTDGQVYQVWDQTLYDQYVDNESSLYNMSNLEKTGLLIRADTLQGLADAMGVPADKFVATMEKYNSDVKTYGYDTVFDRRYLVSNGGVPFALEKAPFYAWLTCNVIVGTHGGLKRDTQARVLDLYGNPIPGLYAAGHITTYSMFGGVPLSRSARAASGIGFGGALIWGRLAAQNIAAEQV